MRKLLKKRWYILVALLILGGLIFYQTTKAQTNDAVNKPYTVKKEVLKDTLSLSGKIEAEEKATLRFQTSGYLAWIGVKEGDEVKKYQTLASLDQREVKKQLEKELDDYQKTRWTFDQTKDDNNSIVTTAIKRILDKSQFDLNNAVRDVEIQNLALEFSNLWTPIDGIVTKINTPYAGVNITPSQAEFEVVNPQTVFFSALADQTDVVKLITGQSGIITLDSFPDKTIAGKITSISFTPKTGETGTVYEIKITINPGNQYRLGMTGDVEFTLSKKENVITIPLTYLKTEKTKKYVLKKNGKETTKTFLKLGEETDDLVEVKEGLSAGDVIY